MNEQKESVKAHWERETCGIRYSTNIDKQKFYHDLINSRYQLEPYILTFAKFNEAEQLKVLEIGVGAGVDFSNWCNVCKKHPPRGIDLTEASIEHTRELLRSLQIFEPRYTLQVADAEALPFESESFDLVYSWGVLHHSPDPEQCFKEVFRVLKPGGVFKAMVYHSPSWVGFLLWLRYGLLKGHLFIGLKKIIFHYLESPGTKAYTMGEIKKILTRIGYENVRLATKLSPGDLLTIKLSDKYQTITYKLLQRIYPRWLVKLLGDCFGLCLLIEAKKPI